MAEVRFIPAKQIRERVQFTTDELELLCEIVRPRIRDKRVDDSRAEKLVHILIKLKKALRRAGV